MSHVGISESDSADPVSVTGTVEQAVGLLTAPLSIEPCVADEQSEQEFQYNCTYEKTFDSDP